MKFIIHFSVIALLLWTLLHSYQQHTPLTLEEDHDVHLLKKVENEKKFALIPYLKVSLILIVLLMKESWIFRFLYFLSAFRRRFFNPVFYQANYIASLTH
ncbi:hypothetical protein ACQKIC_06715 [Peribacillus sp. NPDC046944]|uniref:hypothetical protein n=1 Tax=unclassified Peribacillus TaxID=2675266 RepID=UPI003D00048A